MKIEFNKIGVIHTPYVSSAPNQPIENAEGEFKVVLDSSYAKGLYKLNQFKYIYLIYYIHALDKTPRLLVKPPWAGGVEVGVFASRSPLRPNPIGLSIVKIKRIENNTIYTSGLDVFDGTPLLDIKPYIKDLDSKEDANYGWIEELEGKDHLLLHIKGIPHEY